MTVHRFAWDDFPAVWIHCEESVVKGHRSYIAAKSGDSDAAFELIEDTLSSEMVADLAERFKRQRPILVSAHALESLGVNAIPEALAVVLGERLGWPVDSGIVQANVVSHTGADGFGRMARQAEFEWEVMPNAQYCIVDDFVGQGGTLANLRGHLIAGGARVVGATVLTGKSYSANLNSTEETIENLLIKHGNGLEAWWKDRFGFGFECLTKSEGRYLLNTPTVERIRDRIVAAVQD